MFSLPDNTQFSTYINENSTLQLTKSISKDLQKLLKCFNGTAIFSFSYFSFASSATTLPIRLDLYSNEELFALHTFALVAI